MLAILVLLIWSVCGSLCLEANKASCGHEFEVIGCYKQNTAGKGGGFNKTLSNVDWWYFDNHPFEVLLCNCSALARAKGYIAFTFHDYVECHGTDDFKKYHSLIENEDNASDQCINEEYEDCMNGEEYCMGGPDDQYVYKLNYTGSGIFTQWSEFSVCSKSCGEGTQYRSRKCASGGHDCNGSSREVKACNMQKCIDHWGSWSSYTSCSKTCDEGTKARRRECIKAISAGDDQKKMTVCDGVQVQYASCNIRLCFSRNHFTIAIDGNWGDWGDYGACSKTCGGGTKERTRKCDNPAPAHGGKGCEGSASQSLECNTVKCPSTPVNGNWGDWGDYGACSKTCGGGTKERTRKCDNPAPAHGGKGCEGSASQSLGCNTVKCPSTPVNGNWGDWGDYGACSKTCGGGTKERTRQCNNPVPAHGGKGCKGKNEETRICNTQICPGIDHWGSWSSYTSCSKTCDEGTKTRRRECIKAISAGDDQKKTTVCDGVQVQYASCNIRLCFMKVTCYSKFTPWYHDKGDNPEALTYHKVYCADWYVLNRVQLKRNMFRNRYRYHYRCCHSQLPCDDRHQTSNKPSLNNSTMLSLNHQPVNCGKFGVSYFKLHATTSVKKKQYLSYSFDCCEPRNTLAGTICYNENTGFKNIKNKRLDAHAVSCTKGDNYFIADFKVNSNSTRHELRYDYKCCKIDPVIKP